MHELRNVRGTFVLVRVDYNVPIRSGKVTDTERIERSASTIRHLADRGARIILLTHLGRPEGRRDLRFSVRPLVPLVQRICGLKTHWAPDCIGPAAERIVGGLREGEVALLENVRFYEEETTDSIIFASQLAAHGNYFINEAFSNAHRAHASVHAITRLLPSFAGLNFAREVEALAAAMSGFQKPSCAIVGGAKISTKFALLERLALTHTRVLTGGGIANTLLAAKGVPLSQSLVERSELPRARKLLRRFGAKILLPDDAVIVDTEGGPPMVLPVASLRRQRGSWAVSDIGPRTRERYAKEIARCRTVVWNGPLGRAEEARFRGGTDAIAAAVGDAAGRGSYCIAGGGETVEALKASGRYDALDFVSTAGGAMLEFLEGRELPGVEPLMKTRL